MLDLMDNTNLKSLKDFDLMIFFTVSCFQFNVLLNILFVRNNHKSEKNKEMYTICRLNVSNYISILIIIKYINLIVKYTKK